MSNQYQNVNASQLNPALLQAMAAAQAQVSNNGGPSSNNFSQFHQAFQRLQSQESQKFEQQRLGAGITQQPGYSQTQSNPQQFLQMMQQSMSQGGEMQPGTQQKMQQGMLGMSQGLSSAQNVQHPSLGMAQGMPGISNGSTLHLAPQGFPQVPIGSIPLSEMNLQGYHGIETMGDGINAHSQHQGLSLPMDEQGRRQMLQNLLSQHLQNMPQPSVPTSSQMRDFIRTHPEFITQMQQRHSGNQTAVINDLQRMLKASEMMSTSALPTPTLPNHQMPAFSIPQPVSTASHNAPLQHRSGHMDPQPSPQTLRQRVPSAESLIGISGIDPKQMEALQAIKAAQQRGGHATPQTIPNSLPTPSPQDPRHQRLMSQSLSSSKANDVQAMIQGWGDNQLIKSTIAVIGRLSGQPGSNDTTKYHLLQIIAEWKRRGKQVPNEALQAAGQTFGNPAMVQQLANTDWMTLANFAQSKADMVGHIENGANTPNGSHVGTQANPIDIATPTAITTPQMAPRPFIPNSAYQTPPSQLQSSHTQPSRSSNPPVRPWANLDFRLEPIPIKDDQFWTYLGQMHYKRNEPMTPPRIENRPVNLCELFSLVHKNGGNARVCNNIQLWAYMGGNLGLSTETGQPGQTPRSSNDIAVQLRGLYSQYLQPLEDMFYQKLHKEKMKEGPVVSAQFLEAVSQAPTASMSDTQRRMLEDAKQKSMPLTAQLAAMRHNPAMAYAWIKHREEAMKSKFPKEFRNLPEEDKRRFVAEIRAMLPAAKEAQVKLPKFLPIAMDSSNEEAGTIMTLISMYMFIFIAWRFVESGRFPFSLGELAKLRDPLNKTLFKFNKALEQAESSELQSAFAMFDAMSPEVSTDIAAKLPKGLRVEDLKPPPVKRRQASTHKFEMPKQELATSPRNLPGKRKRQDPSRMTAKHSPASDNSLGINLDATDFEIQQYAPFFAQFKKLRGGQMDWGGSESALEESDANREKITNLSDYANAVAGASRDDDLFEQFIDVSQVEEAPHWAVPTPELFRATSRDADSVSPESIRTVSSVGKTPLTQLEEVSVIMGGSASPESRAYNGTVFGDWEGFDFGLAQA